MTGSSSSCTSLGHFHAHPFFIGYGGLVSVRLICNWNGEKKRRRAMVLLSVKWKEGRK